MNITFNDISKRIRNKIINSSDNTMTPRLYTEHNVFCVNNATHAIDNWRDLAKTSNEAFDKALDIYSELCLNENESVIRKYGNYLAENVDKVRDPMQLMNSLKYRTSHLKSKITAKINNTYKPVNGAIANSIAAINNSIKGAGASIDTNPKKQDTVEECFNLLMHEAKKNIECDRVINNYSKVSKRFNIDRIVSEVKSYNDIYVALIEIAKCIDTYNIPLKNKYCHALEVSYYALNKNNMNYPSDKIIEAVTDYFIFSNSFDNNNINCIKEVMNISVLFESKDFNSVSYLYEEDTEFNRDLTASELIDAYCSPFNEDGKDIKVQMKEKKKELKKAGRTLIKDAKKGNPDERLDRDVKRQIDEFRKECLNDKDNKSNMVKLKALVTNIFAKNPYQIVYQLPNVFGIVRALIVIGPLFIHPAISLVAFITMQIIKLAMTRKQTEKIVKAYQSEIDSVKSKLEKAKDEETKKNIEKYLDELNKDYEKIKTYENDLYSSEENDERDTSTEYGKDYDDDFDDWDDDWDDWDDDDLEEAASIIYISDLMQSISEGLVDDNNIDGIIFNNLFKLDNDSIDALTDFSITVPVILERNKLCEALVSYRDDLRSGNRSVNDYIRIDCLNDNIRKLKEDNIVYATSNNLGGIKCYLACLNEMVNMNMSKEYITELNFTNTLKLAVDRLKKTATKLKDKDKQMSNSIDVAVNNVSKGLETSLMNDNREAVINGRILPSASKCIKIACVLGVSWAINPAVAVIVAIGGFACNKKLKSKERQLIMDDIDIELKMVDRYIKQAEDEGDLKKVRQLEIIQRNLQRQQQRIRYKMHVVYKKHDAVAPINGDNDY